MARVTISDGPHRWIVTYLNPTTSADFVPTEEPLPNGMDYTNLAFMPPFAFMKVEWIEPLGASPPPISEGNPTPAVVVASETGEVIYELGGDDR